MGKEKIHCPFCDPIKFKIKNNSVCICLDCKEYFTKRVPLEVLEQQEFNEKKEYVIDCKGQTYFWEDLELGRVKVY